MGYRISSIGIIAKLNGYTPEQKELATKMIADLQRFCSFQSIYVSASAFDGKVNPGTQDPDLFVALGGDGTMLYASKFSAKLQIPVLGVNLGNVGFITPVEAKDFMATIVPIIRGNYQIQERSLLQCEEVGKYVFSDLALNDVLIQRATNKLIELDIFIDDQFAYSTRADGILLSTPSGSTAYSLSAGGSIIHPTSKVVEITPLMPQTLSNKSIIVPQDSKITVKCLHSAKVFIDGQEVGSEEKPQEYKIKVAKEKALFALPQDHESSGAYYKGLRNKLHWQVQHGK